jgi:hypothetical protein
MSTTFALDELLTPRQKARLKQGQARLLAAGMVSLAVYDDNLKPIVKEERLQDIWAAMMAQLLEHYPMLLLGDSGPLAGALQTATYIGLLLGSQYSFPPELVALVRPDREEG